MFEQKLRKLFSLYKLLLYLPATLWPFLPHRLWVFGKYLNFFPNVAVKKSKFVSHNLSACSVISWLLWFFCFFNVLFSSLRVSLFFLCQSRCWSETWKSSSLCQPLISGELFLNLTCSACSESEEECWKLGQSKSSGRDNVYSHGWE